MKKILILIVLGLGIVAASSAQKAEIFSPNGKAIKGFDVVAFFTQSAPVKGFDSISYKWKEADWLFQSVENKALFIANPEKYAPEYGGYCAYGTAAGHKAPTETNTWTILNNKLYFNYNNKVKEAWNKNRDTLIVKANQQWPNLKNKE